MLHHMYVYTLKNNNNKKNTVIELHASHDQLAKS